MIQGSWFNEIASAYDDALMICYQAVATICKDIAYAYDVKCMIDE